MRRIRYAVAMSLDGYIAGLMTMAADNRRVWLPGSGYYSEPTSLLFNAGIALHLSSNLPIYAPRQN